MDLTVDYVSYSRTLTKAGDGLQWESLSLPFTPTLITANDTVINWRQSADGQGQLLIKEFAYLVDDSVVTFDYPAEFVSNVPYIMSAAKSLLGKQLTFSTSNTVIPASDAADILSSTNSYTYKGSVYKKTVAGAYVMNETGTAFTRVDESSSISPFSAYFISKLPEAQQVDSILLPQEELTAIQTIRVGLDSAEPLPVYNLHGMQVGTTTVANGVHLLPNLPRGTYIVNRKKIVY